MYFDTRRKNEDLAEKRELKCHNCWEHASPYAASVTSKVRICMGFSVTDGASAVTVLWAAGKGDAPAGSSVDHCLRLRTADTGWLVVKLTSATLWICWFSKKQDQGNTTYACRHTR